MERQARVYSHSFLCKKVPPVLDEFSVAGHSSTILKTNSDHHINHGRIESGLGLSCFREHSSIGKMVSSHINIPHKHLGIHGSVYCSEVSRSPSGISHFGQDGQHLSSTLYKQVLVNQISDSEPLVSKNLVPHQKETMVSVCFTHKGSDEYLGRQSFKIQSSFDRRVSKVKNSSRK